jgi:hypothetical protein
MPSIFQNITSGINGGSNLTAISNLTDGPNITGSNNNDPKNYTGEIIFLSFIGIVVLMCCFVCLFDVVYNCQKNISKKFRNCCFKIKNSQVLCCCLKKYKKTHEATTDVNYNFLVKNCLIMDKLDQKEEDDCPICLDKLNGTDDINDGDKLLKIKTCGHVFHANCVYPWFDTQFKDNKHSLNCPLCRAPVNILWEKPIKNIDEMGSVSSGSEPSYWND